MYEGYWGLREKPFRKTPDPRYLFLNDTYEEALERLIFAVEEVELALLTGEVGSGKTLLTRALVDRLGDRYEVGMILNPRLSPRQFLKATAAELGVGAAALPHERPPRADPRAPPGARRAGPRRAPDRGRGAPHPRQAHLRGDPPPHELPARRPQPRGDRAGGPAGAARAAAPPRVPRAHAEDRGVVRPRAAGGRGHRATTWPTGWRWRDGARTLFTDEAVARLHAAAGGIPRVLNQLATQALVEGMARGAERVDGAVAAAVASERDWDAVPAGTRG